jgi:hypothetical protein
VIQRNETALTLDDHKRAFTEVSFLMEIFIQTMKDLVGGGTMSVARNAGKQMGKKLPIYLEQPSLDEVLGAVLGQLSAGFETEFRTDPGGADVAFGRCAIRDVCMNRNAAPGGELCKVFHGFLAGILNEHYGRPVRTTKIQAAADECMCRLESD